MCLVGADSLVHVSQDALPGDAFALSLNKVWEVIRSQKDLNLPAHKVCCHLCHLMLNIVKVRKMSGEGENTIACAIQVTRVALKHAINRLTWLLLAHSK